METLDLSLLDANAGHRILASRFDAAARKRTGFRLDNHDLDTELVELASVFGRRLVAHAELREVLVEQQRAMQGLAHRLLRVAGIALGLGANHFADRNVGDARAKLVLEQPSRRHATKPAGLLVLRQELNGQVSAWVGTQLARLTAGRWEAGRLAPLAAGDVAVRLELQDAGVRTRPFNRDHRPAWPFHGAAPALVHRPAEPRATSLIGPA